MGACGSCPDGCMRANSQRHVHRCIHRRMHTCTQTHTERKPLCVMLQMKVHMLMRLYTQRGLPLQTHSQRLAHTRAGAHTRAHTAGLQGLKSFTHLNFIESNMFVCGAGGRVSKGRVIWFQSPPLGTHRQIQNRQILQPWHTHAHLHAHTCTRTHIKHT